jgi:hypothetical protein
MKFIKKYTDFIIESIEIPQEEFEKATDLMGKIINTHKTVRESPKGSKKGPKVSDWLRTAGVKPGLNWCMAFVYGVFDEWCKGLGSQNTLPKTAGVMDHWDKTDMNLRINIEDVKKDPDILKPGMIFIMHRAKSKGQKNLGHTGIIISVDPAKKTFVAIEGNTNDQGSGQGGRVGINTRSLGDPLLVGFTDYLKTLRSPEFDGILSQTVQKYVKDDLERIKYKNPISH